MKKNNAFTLAEVLLSLFILTGAVYVLSNLQFKSSRKVIRSTNEVERVFPIKKQLYSYFLHPPTSDKPLKVVLDDPNVVITAHKQEIDKKKSELKDFAKSVDIIWAEGESGAKGETVKLISFVPKPEKKSNEKKS
jgi:type II secretory pathway pseudopilin PulG